MSTGSAARIGRLALAGAVLAAAGGYLDGRLAHPDPTVNSAGTGGSAAPVSLRDHDAALAAMARHGHWGSYTVRTPPAGSASDEAAATSLHNGLRLVGVETRGDRRSALLLLPAASVGNLAGLRVQPDANGLFRIRAGDTLARGITVITIGSGSVELDTAAGRVTLELYGNGS